MSFQLNWANLRLGILVHFLLCHPGFLFGAHYFVATTGQDAPSQNGLTWEQAWNSLAYAVARASIEPGPHTIELGAGTFTLSRTVHLGANLTIQGQSAQGANATRLVAADSWPLTPITEQLDPPEEYLLSAKQVKQITIRQLELCSKPEYRITGAIRCQGCEQVKCEHLIIREFRWAGLTFNHCRQVVVQHCQIIDASQEKGRHRNGLIRTRWLSDSELSQNQIQTTTGGGYGYKGGGHYNVRIHHNRFVMAGGFAIESAHENEIGVEIDHNYANRCISIPKGGQGADPNQRGFAYSFWIHHNLLTDSYTVEGPRNHLRLSHNYIRIEKPGGRVYTQHGGKNHGPVWIHHNVVENLDRAFVWMNQGLAENIEVYHNTIHCAIAGQRAGILFDSFRADRLNHWRIHNNLILADPSEPRIFVPSKRDSITKMTVTHNACLHLLEVPEKNIQLTSNPCAMQGQKPYPYFSLRDAEQPAIDRGMPWTFAFVGTAPDIGAYEWGQTPTPWEVTETLELDKMPP